jgi:hypothetical protein
VKIFFQPQLSLDPGQKFGKACSKAGVFERRSFSVILKPSICITQIIKITQITVYTP